MADASDTLVARSAWQTRVPVRFSHCDPAGIVYFARYFDLLNGVVEDWFCQGLGIDYHEMIGPRRTGLGFASAGAEFVKPGFMGDCLDCTVLVDRIGRSSLTFHIHATRAEEPILTARFVMVTTSLETHRSVPLPDDLRAALERYWKICQ
ncbi:acyl-CoA thioesterase [Microvirga puerhi]|uniref:Acyl-CoA thioesterase n=1 Tax=Microvirga puerhi TaxID=2876078 RepID=A0ABS7VJ01_9HYPH|nr:thioesterase family protein [Microvirga puerhi]MBZ6075075.1 acyl-CoA thioesterase [Microvirga puerhi]